MLQVLYSYIIASGFLLDYLFDVVAAAAATMTKKVIAIWNKFEGFWRIYPVLSTTLLKKNLQGGPPPSMILVVSSRCTLNTTGTNDSEQLLCDIFRNIYTNMVTLNIFVWHSYSIDFKYVITICCLLNNNMKEWNKSSKK